MVSLLVKEKLYVNEVVLGTAVGVIFGPYCADIFNPRAWGGDINVITLEVMRVTLATGLFAIGVELPQSYLADHAMGLLVMVVPTMAFGWLVVAAIVFVVFPPINFVSSLVIAACLTPTDPIISAAIVGGKFATKHVPLNLRQIIAAESAANDGLAYPFLSISIYLTVEASRGVAFEKWFLIGWLCEYAVTSIAFSYLMKLTHRKGFIDRESYVAQYLSLAIFTIGVARTLGVDDLLAAFAAGSAISWDGHFNSQVEEEVFSSVIDLILNCGCFVYIGAWMPFNMFNATDLSITPWRLVIIFVAVMFLRRIPSLLFLYRWVPEITTWREALFTGHFGPMGVGAIFISTLAVTELPVPESPPANQAQLLAATLQPIVAFVVLGSILIHGLSIPFFSFGRRVRTRTLSITRTWTARNAPAPDWLLWARRTPGDPEPPFPTTTQTDVERGTVEEGVTQAIDGSSDEDKSRNMDNVPELGPAALVSDATAVPPHHAHARTPSSFSFGLMSDSLAAEDRVPGSSSAPSIEDAPAASVEELLEPSATPPLVGSKSVSGTATPVSFRAVRFPPEDEMRKYLAERGLAASPTSAPGSPRTVRFPSDVVAGFSSGAKDALDGDTGEADGKNGAASVAQ
ncbi:Sodium/hydrogen exchanger family-domain-containing protein [Epithele typhae]|uniref:Sodium/hydrogen exchanger family-domain-containing protein n=1 Tax=Epithele typhae TaxID=378194 RepID=UPI002008B359|nr:Sodium/hydrogen exchanger family-domain-containing protein [Epithele typhae]KAH9940411.1 Sodium/hydrogen exchanger family-domain-containing protein [Epithele typhae]